MSLMTLAEVMAEVEKEGITGEVPFLPSPPADQIDWVRPLIGRPLSNLPPWVVLSLSSTEESRARLQEMGSQLQREPLFVPEGEEEGFL